MHLSKCGLAKKLLVTLPYIISFAFNILTILFHPNIFMEISNFLCNLSALGNTLIFILDIKVGGEKKITFI
ncbi:hypothetical protein C1646_689020 [Rhizophagus diaphanus]|nr:hypothetical protein C1646_689020 [Rhizophagus diaphanus] [Rhizophagus sp. MUCL 43196]